MCHSDFENGGCKLFWTKEHVTPPEFAGLQDAVYVWRARQKAGLKPLEGLPWWAEKAHIIATVVFQQIEAEQSERTGEPDEGTIGGQEFTKGDSDAFSLIAEHIQQSKVKSVKRVYGRQPNSSD